MSPVLTTDNFYYRLQSIVDMMVDSDFIDTLTKPFLVNYVNTDTLCFAMAVFRAIITQSCGYDSSLCAD